MAHLIKTNNKNVCVWRLFDPDKTNRHRSLIYNFNYNRKVNKNVVLSVFSEFDEYPILFDEQGSEDDAETFFSIDSLNYNTSNVYLMAKKSNFKDNRFEVNFGFAYEEKFPLNGFEIFLIVFFVLFFIFAMALVAVLYANREGYIDIYIPKKMRKYCVKD